MSKLKLVIEDCALCGGCEIALADLGLELLQLLDKKLDLVYAPVLASTRDYDSADIALIIGTVRTEHDLQRVRKAREKCKLVVAFGSCSSTTALIGLGNLYSKDELLRRAYGAIDPSLSRGQVKLLEKVEPLSNWIKVDYIVPGCPPPKPVIRQIFRSILRGVA